MYNSPDTVEPPERFVALAGALNLRDLGGYPTESGRRTRWRLLFRSGTTHALTDEGLERLGTYGIRYVYDFRSRSEREDHPSRLLHLHAVSYHFIDHTEVPGDIRRALEDPRRTQEDTRAVMHAAYRQLPMVFKHAYRALFRHLENADLPMVFNCSVGKDRTGVAAALVLLALGVPRERVVEDYLLTERCFDQSCEILLTGKLSHLFTAQERAVWEPVMRAEEGYLISMLDELTQRYGSVHGYLERELGVFPDTIARLQAILLEP